MFMRKISTRVLCVNLIVNTPDLLITDHVLMNKNMYKLVEHDCPGERGPE